MNKASVCLLIGAIAVMTSSIHADDKSDNGKTPAVLNFKMKSLQGKDVDLSQYKGKVLLIVNTASECGYTPQYAGLQELHEKFSSEGLAVLGFPCNQFGAQEPGTSEQITAFCKKNYGVTFDMFEKVDVNGKKACGLYKLLTSKEANSRFAGPVKWNFEKFLVARNGRVVARFRSGVEPESGQLVKAVQAELAK